jgi:hypothetical protein
MKLYASRCVLPAVWLKHQPQLKTLIRCDYRHGALQVQWRWPREVRHV